jgi:hypothetical protein
MPVPWVACRAKPVVCRPQAMVFDPVERHSGAGGPGGGHASGLGRQAVATFWGPVHTWPDSESLAAATGARQFAAVTAAATRLGREAIPRTLRRP